jgi:hypothetical protein
MKYVQLGIFFILLCCSTEAFAQKLNSISTRWNDSFVEWDIFTTVPPDPDAPEADETEDPEPPAEEKKGELKQRWLNVKDDWSEWDYQLGDEQGVIKVKWKDNPGEWELRSYDRHIITMRSTFPRNFTEWRVTDNDISLNIKSKYTTQLDEWLVDDATHGKFYLYTLRAQDPRDWAIEDNLDAKVSQSFKIALMFIAIFNSVPRV